jgi:MoaA/NifB/PqqE/SkfB family radical SAM enzyme
MTGRSRGLRIVQVHPTRFCNLRCRHCYSMSGPERRESLGEEVLARALSDAAAEGFEVASFSGGEPLLYPHLMPVLDRAKAEGLGVTVTTNGTLLDPEACAALRGRVDLVAVSVDGSPTTHDAIRASAGAFRRMEQGIANLRRAGIPFGVIHTLTRGNLHELTWVAHFAQRSGAELFQVHPLEEVGRAELDLAGQELDSAGLTAAVLSVAAAHGHLSGEAVLQYDVANRDDLCPLRTMATPWRRSEEEAPLADLCSPIVIEPDGSVVPLQYGFSRDYVIGDLGRETLTEAAERWRSGGYRRLRRLCQQVYEAERARSEAPLFNWNRAVMLASGELSRDSGASVSDSGPLEALIQ